MMLTEEQRKFFEDEKISVACYYDCDVAHSDWEECIGHNKDGTYWYRVGEEPGDLPHLHELIDKKKLFQESFDTIEKILSQCDGDQTSVSFEEVLEDPAWLTDAVESIDFTEDSLDALQGYLTERVEVHTTRGYSQGDCEDVFIFGMKDDTNESYVYEMIDHLFWDAPVNVRLDIGDESYYLDECKDVYIYDKDECVEYFAKSLADKYKDTEAFKEYLREILPEYPEYVY